MSSSSRTAVVTGGASGIGHATAKALADDGWDIVVLDLQAEAGEKVAAELQALGVSASFHTLDVADTASVEKVFAAIADTGQPVKALVNCAGISPAQAATEAYPTDEWQRCLDINLSGSFYTSRAAIPLIRKAGGGSIVNISSIMGQVAVATDLAYAASKHGVIGLTKAVAQELAAEGIRVNAVGPGFIETPMTEIVKEVPEFYAMVQEGTPAKRFGQPEEVAALIAFLCSDKAAFITGSYYPIDGGFLTH